MTPEEHQLRIIHAGVIIMIIIIAYCHIIALEEALCSTRHAIHTSRLTGQQWIQELLSGHEDKRIWYAQESMIEGYHTNHGHKHHIWSQLVTLCCERNDYLSFLVRHDIWRGRPRSHPTRSLWECVTEQPLCCI